MAITPINISRTSFNMQGLSLLDSLRRNTMNLFLEQNRLASGLRLNAPSEDPVLGTQATRLSELLEHQDQILGNIRYADDFLAATDTAIGEVNDLLMQAKSIASEMVNSHADQDQRDSMAELVLGMIDQLVMVGNRTFMGVSLLAGQQTMSTPFTQDTGGVEYRGDLGVLTSHVDTSMDPQVNLTGHDVFGVLSGVVAGIVDLDPALTLETRLADLDGTTGKGVNRNGSVRITLDAPATSFSVDLRTADNAGDVIDLVNQAAADAGLAVGPGGDFNMTLNPAADGFTFDVAGGTTVTVEDLGASTVARDLGLVGSGFGGLGGIDVNVRLTPMTSIDTLFGGTGAGLGTLQLSNGEMSTTLDLSGAETVQDLINLFNNAGIEVEARINEDGTGLDIVNLVSGLTLKIGEDGGNTAETLGIRTMHADTPLSELNNGRGVSIREDHNDLEIIARDGSNFFVNLDGAETVGDVIDLINTAAGDAGVNVTASLTTQGNGIRLQDNTGGAGDFVTQAADYSEAINGLGLEFTVSGSEIISLDVSGVEPASVFTALINLHEALVTGGEMVEQNITAAAETLQLFIDKTNTMQGVIGSRSRAMTTRLQLTEDAVVATQTLLSEVRDLDYTEAVTRFQMAQTALQANLMTGSQLMQMTLMDYL